MPMLSPADSEIRTRMITPGERSAPGSRPERMPVSRRESGDGSKAVNAIVPAIAHDADEASAATGATMAAVSVTSSGPPMKMLSLLTESRAYAGRTSSGRPASSDGHIERRTDEAGGLVAPATSAQAGQGHRAHPDRWRRRRAVERS